MDEKELDAGPVTLLRLFKGEREYISPLFQRRYVWTNKEIDRLWVDIDSILEGTEKTKFLGAIVLEVKNSGLAFQPDSYWIIDGQQRLTTLYSTILHLAIEAEKSGNIDLANSLYKQYLFNQDGQYKNQPKLVPTIQDNTQFKDIFKEVDNITPKLRSPYGDSKGKLASANKKISLEIRKRCYNGSEFDDEKATNLISTILEKLKFVQIALGSHQEPQQVYDALNNAGVRLDTKDIIRNKVFQKVSKEPDEAMAYYENYWVPLETNLGERFDKYFFPFALVNKSTVTKTSLVSELNKRWENWTPDQIVNDLSKYVSCYNALTSNDENSRDNFSKHIEITEGISRLYRMKVPSSTYPFIFKLIEKFESGELDKRTTIHNLNLIESFLVRRAFSGLEPTGLHAVFKDLWNSTKGSPELFIETIDKNPTIQFPDDDEFKKNIIFSSFYTKKIAPYIVTEYERSIRTGDPYPEEIKATLDHVMPKTLNAKWSNIDKNDHEKYKHTWANIVPISGKANSEKGQKGWDEVKDYLTTQTVFKTTKLLAQKYDHWDIDTIKERADDLSIWAVSRWPKD